MNTNEDKLKAEITMEHLAKLRTALPMLADALGLEQNAVSNTGMSVPREFDDGNGYRTLTLDLPNDKVLMVGVWIEDVHPMPFDMAYIRATKQVIEVPEHVKQKGDTQ